jgi:hypothetical protein
MNARTRSYRVEIDESISSTKLLASENLSTGPFQTFPVVALEDIQIHLCGIEDESADSMAGDHYRA